MPIDLPLSCCCGRVRGLASEIAPSTGFRFVCYCKDCQAFARFLAHVPEKWRLVFRQGHAPTQESDVLDVAGGTDIFQMPPARVTLTAGTDAVRCLRFSGKVLRWYADCCRTPLANTASSPRFPVVALIHSFMDQAFTDQLAHGRTRDEALGPPLCRIYERSAIAPLPPTAPPPASFRIFAGRGAALLGWWARGLGRPNPFFDADTGGPLFGAARAHAERARRALNVQHA
jgi:Family of unknown function (DUF6151)